MIIICKVNDNLSWSTVQVTFLFYMLFGTIINSDWQTFYGNTIIVAKKKTQVIINKIDLE